jgi:hypothetical protein
MLYHYLEQSKSSGVKALHATFLVSGTVASGGREVGELIF